MIQSVSVLLVAFFTCSPFKVFLNDFG